MMTNNAFMTALGAGAVAVCILLDASTAKAAELEVIFVEGTKTAIEVRNLDIDGTLYTVSFRYKHLS